MKARQLIDGLRWTALGTVVTVIAQFGFAAVLARLVEPAAFGLLLMANVVLRFASFFAQMGTTQSLIQRPALDAAFSTAALCVSLSISSMLYLVISVSVPLFAWYFKNDQLNAVVWILGLTLVIGGASGPAVALLRRAGRFKALSLMEVVSYILGYGCTGVACAWAGMGVWSLVVATLAQQTIMAALAFWHVRYPLAWPLQRAAVRQVLGSGSQYSTIGFLEFIWSNMEGLAAGRYLGAAPLGVLNRAQMLANLPVEQGMNAVHKVLFPALSAMQGDRQRVSDGFLVLLLASGLLSVVVSAGVSAAAVDIVALLLGPRWGDAVPVLAILAAGVPALFVYAACGTTLESLAALRAKLSLQLTLMPLKAALLWLLWSRGLPGVALAAVVAEYVRTACGLVVIGRVLPLAPGLVPRLMAVLLMLGLWVYAAVSAGGQVAALLPWPLAGRLLLQAATGGVAVLLAAAMLVRWGGSFPPLRRFDALRRWHNNAYRFFFRTSPA